MELVAAIISFVILVWVLITLGEIKGELTRIRTILYTDEPWGINTKLANLTTIAASEANELQHR